MAPRRSAPPPQRIDLEIIGVGLIAFGLVLGVAMLSPGHHAGAISFFVRSPLVAIFGDLAAGVPVVITLTGVVCFLELAEPGAIVSLALAFFMYLIMLSTAFPTGAIGTSLHRALSAVVGDLTGPVLTILTLMLTVAVTGVSLKRLLGRLFLSVRDSNWSGLKSLNLELPPYQNPNGGKKPGKTAKGPHITLPTLPSIDFPAIFGGGNKPVPEAVTTTGGAPYAPPRREQTPALAGAPQVSDAARPAVDVATRHIPTISEDLQYGTDDELEIEGHIVEGEPARRRRNYLLPPLSLFDEPIVQATDDGSRADLLVSTLDSFGVKVQVVRMERGPSITRYELKPDKGVKISRITALADDLALALAAVSVRIEAPIPGKSAVGIEVPNAVVSVVAIREILEALPNRGSIPPLAMALGKDITGQPVFGDLARMPHLLVAGATGAGKSVCLNNIIASLLTCATPDQVQLLMIDPKRVELTVYNGIPHLVKEVITDARLAAGALFEMTKEMDSRYERFAKAGVRKIEEYNAKFADETLPYVVIIIDELADLMLVAPAKVETTICRLAQLARATGIHLIVATQRPSVDVITGIIKANIPSRIAFAVSSQVDSRTILDMGGAERLLGRGDMLFLPIDAPKPRRAQGALITGDEVNRLVEFWSAQARPKNLVEVEVVAIDEEDDGKGLDPLSYDAARFIIETNYASTAQLQSQFQIGHPRAVRLMKGLEDMKVVGPHEGTKPRKIVIGLGDLDLMAPRFGRKPEPYLDGTMPDEFGG